jgi:hypothetical protein
MRPEIPLSDDEKARKILTALDHMERRRKIPRVLGCLPWIVAIGLAIAILVVILTNRRTFTAVWNHVIRPQSAVEDGK